MSKATQIKAILLKAFKNVYCESCKGENCDDCYRKNIGWEISESHAELITDKILEVNNE